MGDDDDEGQEGRDTVRSGKLVWTRLEWDGSRVLDKDGVPQKVHPIKAPSGVPNAERAGTIFARMIESAASKSGISPQALAGWTAKWRCEIGTDRLLRIRTKYVSPAGDQFVTQKDAVEHIVGLIGAGSEKPRAKASAAVGHEDETPPQETTTPQAKARAVAGKSRKRGRQAMSHEESTTSTAFNTSQGGNHDASSARQDSPDPLPPAAATTPATIASAPAAKRMTRGEWINCHPRAPLFSLNPHVDWSSVWQRMPHQTQLSMDFSMESGEAE